MYRINKVIYNNTNLMEYFNSSLCALEVIYVCEGLKPMIRVAIKREKLKQFTSFVHENEIYYKLSKYSSFTHKEEGKGNFSNVIYRVPNTGENVYVYVANEKERLVKDIDELPDKEFGLLLGYPKCCVDHYTEYLEKAVKNKMDFYPFACTEKFGSAFINFGIRYFGISFISHFPCSLQCEESIEIAKSIYSFLSIQYPDIAAYFMKNLKSTVLYFGSKGVFYTNEFTIEKEQNKLNVFYSNIQTTYQNEIFKELNNNKSLELLSNNCIKVNNNIYFGSNVRGNVYL